MSPSNLVKLLSPSRLKIVEFIKRQGSVTVEDCAEALGLAETTIRQHMSRLEDMSLIAHRSVAQGPGRPTLEYSLTPAAEQLYPSQDGPLFGKMVQFLLHQGYPELIDEFFRKMWRERGEHLFDKLGDIAGDKLEERLQIVREFLEEEGFVPEVDIDGNRVTIRECNCPFYEARQVTRLPCRLEAELLQQALQRDLTRVGYMPEGNPTCVYEFEVDSSNADETSGSEQPVNS